MNLEAFLDGASGKLRSRALFLPSRRPQHFNRSNKQTFRCWTAGLGIGQRTALSWLGLATRENTARPHDPRRAGAAAPYLKI